MKRVRVTSLAAAIVVTAIQWAAFFSPMLYTQSLPSAGAGEMVVGSLAGRDEIVGAIGNPR